MSVPLLRAGFPLPTSPLVDPDTGIVTDGWLAFLLLLYGRTGGGTGALPGSDQATLLALAMADPSP